MGQLLKYQIAGRELIDNPNPLIYLPLFMNSHRAIIPSLPYFLLLSKYELFIIARHQFGVQRWFGYFIRRRDISFYLKMVFIIYNCSSASKINMP